MKKGLTELVFILDRSGSMVGLEADTIGGYNSLIEKQKKEEGEAYISTILFDDRCEVLHDRVPVREVKPMTDREYYVRGCTALLDALGGAIHHIANVHKYAREEARKFGIRADRAVKYECDREGTAVNYRVLSETVSRVRQCSAQCMDAAIGGGWKADIEADYQRRHKNK